jgi:transcriptional regulator with XRE-family HTH domain
MSVLRTKSDPVAVVRDKLREAAKESGLTQEEIGLRMGFSKDSSRKAVSRLLNPEIEYDPRLSTLLSFAQAVGQPLKKLIP